ncbi:MAG: glycoside hydrolase family 26 protein [Dysgonamonadaceae bacterium]|jgi:mannan endo-1,4-beta-mannosidase|nr:glycoside hydrolase family 26 protein [Dysgonamonadaceae bacterium]
MQKHSYLIAFIFFLTACTSSPTSKFHAVDPQATPEAKALFQRLLKLQDVGVMYGHQDDLMCGHTWWYEPGRSDIKDAVGDYPAVAGFELGEIETGRDRSLDSISFAQITEQVKWFHKQNGIITISWHPTNPITSQWTGRAISPNGPGSAWDIKKFTSGRYAEPDSVNDFEIKADSLNAVKSILPGGENHAMFNEWLDILADYFKTWTDDGGKPIPFIFRPWHEHSGTFFWWGRERCTDEEYAELWRYTVNYLRDKGLHNILYAYNTDKVYSLEDFMRGYPGDEYIDMLSIDWYGSGEEFNALVDTALNFATRAAEEKGKLFALSECGNVSQDMVDILKKYKVSYFLTWRNAPPRYALPADVIERMEQQREETNKQLRQMYADPHTLFLKDIQNVK